MGRLGSLPHTVALDQYGVNMDQGREEDTRSAVGSRGCLSSLTGKAVLPLAPELELEAERDVEGPSSAAEDDDLVMLVAAGVTVDADDVLPAVRSLRSARSESRGSRRTRLDREAERFMRSTGVPDAPSSMPVAPLSPCELPPVVASCLRAALDRLDMICGVPRSVSKPMGAEGDPLFGFGDSEKTGDVMALALRRGPSCSERAWNGDDKAEEDEASRAELRPSKRGDATAEDECMDAGDERTPVE